MQGGVSYGQSDAALNSLSVDFVAAALGLRW